MIEVLRGLIEKGAAYDGLKKEYEEQIEELDQESEHLQHHLMNNRVEERTDLVEYVEEERSWRSVGFGTRIKWWMFRKSDD